MTKSKMKVFVLLGLAMSLAFIYSFASSRTTADLGLRKPPKPLLFETKTPLPPPVRPSQEKPLALADVPQRHQMCCRAMTAQCLACSQGVSVEEYCKNNVDSRHTIKGCADSRKPTKVVLLSQSCPALADVRGNLGDASVITNSKNDDWLKDRWQAAADMNGTPIPGPHWLVVDLMKESSVHMVEIIFEVACAFHYVIQVAPSGTEVNVLDSANADRIDWKTAWTYTDPSLGQRTDIDSKTRTNRDTRTHTIQLSEFYTTRYVRLYIEEPATVWGTSVYELRISGVGETEEGACHVPLD